MYKRELSKYCDDVEKQIEVEGNTKLVPPFTVGDPDVLTIYSSTWNPKEISREEFINGFILSVKNCIDKYQKMAVCSDSLTNEKIDIDLNVYCNKIERSIPKNYKRTPKKHTEEKHFEWLVKYQVTPTQSYEEISSEIEPTNRSAPEKIKMAIHRLSNNIVISRRKSQIPGRPAKKKK